MSRVKRVWRADEEPVSLHLRFTPEREARVHFTCPQCWKPWDDLAVSLPRTFFCSCGCAMVLRIEVRLDELEEEGGKGE